LATMNAGEGILL